MARGAIEGDYNLPEQSTTGIELIEKLREHLENNNHRSDSYLEGVQDALDLVSLMLGGSKPYPNLKNE